MCLEIQPLTLVGLDVVVNNQHHNHNHNHNYHLFSGFVLVQVLILVLAPVEGGLHVLYTCVIDHDDEDDEDNEDDDPVMIRNKQ